MDNADFIIRKIESGESFVFNKKDKSLILAKAGYHISEKELSPDLLKKLIEEGKARHYAKDELSRISNSLSNLVLLGA